MDDVLAHLIRWTEQDPQAPFAAFLDRTCQPLESHTYGSFEERTRLLAEHLREQSPLEPGDRVVLRYPPGLELVAALVACARIGAIAVPVPPGGPTGRGATARTLAIVRDSGAVVGLTDATLLQPGDAGLRWLATDVVHGSPSRAQPDTPIETLLLQYTSGSTGTPKGVVVPHRTVVHNGLASAPGRRPVGVSWLPQFHDMGLVGYWLFLIVTGGTTYGFSPADFLRRPALWFEALSRHRATITSAPNFGFEYCLSPGRVTEDDLRGCDLSSVEVFMSGSEPVRPATYHRFLRRYAAHGLRRSALVTAYGLAENTLAVTGQGRRVLRVERAALQAGEVCTNGVRHAADDLRELVSCGRPLSGIEVRIVDPATRTEAGPGRAGEVWVAGRSACPGYWNRPGLTADVFANTIDGDTGSTPYVRTGDVGFLDGGELFVCGRLKDVVILRGQNFFAEDLEAAVETAVEGAAPGETVAFRGPDGEERLVVALGVRPRAARPTPEAVSQALRAHGYVGAHTVLLVRRQLLARTTSGKIARGRNRDQWLAGRLPALETHAYAEAGLPSTDDGARGATGFEQVLAAYALTGREQLRPHEAGLDSLALVELLVAVEEVARASGHSELLASLDVPTLQQLTLAEVSELVQAVSDGTPADVTRVRERLARARAAEVATERDAMRRDARLGPLATSRPARPAPGRLGETDLVLLTGATGFLGPFLLDSLLRATTEQYVALVRAEDPGAGRERLRTALTAAGLADPWLEDAFETRVRVVCGDVSVPGLGVAARTWGRLADEVGSVVHNAASVDYLRDYRGLRGPNVDGTRHVLQLVAAAQPKTLHAVSSTAVFGWSAQESLHEDDRNPTMHELDFGYAQSKWVAEQLVHAAREQGVAATIYRPAFLSASTRGFGHSTDIIVRLLAFMVRHRVVPVAHNQLSLLPVDLAAHDMVAVMASGPEAPVHHVTSREPFTILDVTREITRTHGVEFTHVDLPTFSRALRAWCRPDEPAYPLLDFVSRSQAKVALMQHKRYDSTAFQRAVHRAGSARGDATLAETVGYLMAHLVAAGLVAPARDAQAATR